MNLKRILTLTLVIFTGSLATSPLFADRVNKRQKIQKKRIRSGIRSGELTKKETKKLVRQQKKINRFERKAKSDGKLNFKERHKLERMQDRASKKIFKQKHDRQQQSYRLPSKKYYKFKKSPVRKFKKKYRYSKPYRSWKKVYKKSPRYTVIKKTPVVTRHVVVEKPVYVSHPHTYVAWNFPHFSAELQF